MSRKACARIDLKALRHNLAQVRAAAPGAKVMAVIKANGYGHGLVRMATALQEADGFGVACIEEALQLREAGIKQRILLLEGFFSGDELPLIQRHGLDITVHHEAQIAYLEALPRNNQTQSHPLSVWLKIDTGMHRLGISSGKAREAYHRLRRCPFVAEDLRLLTHLACADDPASPVTAQQVATFQQVAGVLDGERSLANSAAILGVRDSHADWVRPGIMLYGVSPFLTGTGEDHGLKPVMTVISELIAVNHFRKGDAVGYGGAWVCPEDMPVGMVAFGYGDGYPRHAREGTPVVVNGKRVPLIGRVSMDMLCVDLRTQPKAAIGDPVQLWGRDLPVEEVASHAGTISYELLCGVSARVRFTEVG
ncbi:MAG: alanine racemase [Gammaproteobacteria bacterium RBG_16_57_12]|nr:MAG: alanine racemase [Gammaproteobacteria bacterium RBG_16_57_12]